MDAITLLLLIAGLVCFLIGSLGRPNRLNFTALGLACWILTIIIPRIF